MEPVDQRHQQPSRVGGGKLSAHSSRQKARSRPRSSPEWLCQILPRCRTARPWPVHLERPEMLSIILSAAAKLFQSASCLTRRGQSISGLSGFWWEGGPFRWTRWRESVRESGVCLMDILQIQFKSVFSNYNYKYYYYNYIKNIIIHKTNRS